MGDLLRLFLPTTLHCVLATADREIRRIDTTCICVPNCSSDPVLLGFTGIAGFSVAFIQLLAIVFITLFVVTLIAAAFEL